MFWKMLQFWQRRRIRRGWLSFVLSLLLLAVVLAIPNGLGQLDRLITDYAARLDARKASSDIVIVTIDDDSIDALGYWPWPRSTHGKVLELLHAAGAKAIGLDLLMSEDDRGNSQEDKLLAQSIQHSNPVVLPIYASQPLGAGGWWKVSKPVAELTQNVAALAHIHLQLDIDGVARSIYLREGKDGFNGGVWSHMALKLLEIGQQATADEREAFKPTVPGVRASQEIIDILDRIEYQGVGSQVISGDWLRDRWMLISYAGQPGSFKRFSFIDVYMGVVPAEEFQNKYVLIGVTAAGLGDAYVTPMTGKDALMPGVEIIANVLDSLLQQEYRYAASPLENVVFNVLLVLCAIPFFYLGRPRTVLIGIFSLIVIDLMLVFILRRYASIQVMPAASLICLMLAYPWWSWRRLELAMRQIRMEFSRMRRENGFFQAPEFISGDQLERDVQVFESAAWQLRDLQQVMRQSLDDLPYAMLVTDESGQVIMSNVQARKIFKVDPPLPTMALAPAMGSTDEQGQIMAVPGHHLSVLLASRFLGSLIYQQDRYPYMKALMAFLEQPTLALKTGSVEINDAHDGTPYLLKVASRITTIERSRGWIVSLVNLSGERGFELQRDQVLRYLQENVYEQLEFLQEKDDVLKNDVASLGYGVRKVVEQTRGFLAYEYARGAIYLYEKVNLTRLVSEVFIEVSGALNKEWDGLQLSKEEPIFLHGDTHMLRMALTDLLQLLMEVCGSEKIPKVRIKFFKDKGLLPAAPTNFVHVYMVATVSEAKHFEQRSFVFDEAVTYSDNMPFDISPDVLKLWSAYTTITRHAGSMKVKKSEHSVGLKIEFLV